MTNSKLEVPNNAPFGCSIGKGHERSPSLNGYTLADVYRNEVVTKVDDQVRTILGDRCLSISDISRFRSHEVRSTRTHAIGSQLDNQLANFKQPQ